MFIPTSLYISFLCVLGVVAKAIPAPGPDGKYTIKSAGISASFIPYSAAITNLFIADRNGTIRDVVLGYDNASYYAIDPIHPTYGATPGRYANRIGNATYVLDGKRYYTPRNDGNGTMHSGPNGWSWRVWNVAEVCDDSITFTLRDEPFSSKGFPGLVLAQVTYKMSPNTWSIKIEAKSQTHRTPLMATNHAYWNLDAFANPINNTVFNQTLSMPYSKRLIDYDATAFPNGSISAIPEYAINDFWSSPKHIGANSTAPGWVGLCGPGFGGYDCAYIMDRPNDAAQQWQHSSVASLYSDWSGIGWSMYSNQEGFAMTSCGFFPLDTLPIKKTQGGPGSSTNGFVPPNGCIAIEAQDWTSGIQFPGWGRLPYQVYGPDDGTYVNEIVYKFSVY